MPVVVVAIRILFCEADTARASISSVCLSVTRLPSDALPLQFDWEALDPGVGFE